MTADVLDEARNCILREAPDLLDRLHQQSAQAAARHSPCGSPGWLTGLISPVGEPCCDGSDCPPVDHRYDAATRELQVLIEGTWIAVDPATLVAMPTPDGGAHACYGRSWLRNQMTPVVRCVILPGEA